MRKIKFRAWNKQTGKMIYSDQVYPRSMYKFEFDLFNDFDFKLMKMVDRYNVTDDEGNDTYQEVFEAVEADIMQYTGMKDVNGKEIYEGDIVKIKFMSMLEDKHFIGEVKFYDGSFMVDNEKLQKAHFLFREFDVLEVIENIYETLELLK